MRRIGCSGAISLRGCEAGGFRLSGAVAKHGGGISRLGEAPIRDVTKADFFREEQRALKPFQAGLFDGLAGD